MTIDSAFISCFKDEAPEAFTPDAPFVPHAVFCDGQIKLMSPDIPGTQTWDDYIRRQFARLVDGYFLRGVRCVIMAFDDYDHVPPAKSMTQLKRRRHLPEIQFNARDCLPPVVPGGERWAQCISNRTFKTKVIHLVIESLVRRSKFGPRQSLIIDYQGAPVRYSRTGEGLLVSEVLEDFTPMGEADIKFVRYTRLYPRLQVDSVDGDSVPIALLHYESGFDGDISIYRMLTHTADEKSHRAALARSARMASGDGDNTGRSVTDVLMEIAQRDAKRRRPSEEADASTVAFTYNKDRTARPKRVYEYLNIGLLFHCLRRNTIPQCVDRVEQEALAGHEISMLVCLIGFAGTDFTRGLPQVSGKTLFEMLPELWHRLSASYDTADGGMHPQKVADHVIASVYRRKFGNHTSAMRLSVVLRELGGSKLSERTRKSLPTAEVVHCTARNINWLLKYWRDQAFESPFSTEYGFVMRGGKPAFEV